MSIIQCSIPLFNVQFSIECSKTQIFRPMVRQIIRRHVKIIQRHVRHAPTNFDVFTKLLNQLLIFTKFA